MSAVVLTANLLSGNTVGQAITAGIGTAVTVSLQILFWVTLIFAIIERGANVESIKGKAWTVDDLPELPDDGRISIADAVSTVIANVFVVVGILWVQLQPPIVIDGQAFPLFDPSLWSFWLPYFIVISRARDRVHDRALHARSLDMDVRRHQRRPRRGVRHPGRLAASERPAAESRPSWRRWATATDGTWLDVTGIVIGVTVVVIVATDAINGFRKAAAMARR